MELHRAHSFLSQLNDMKNTPQQIEEDDNEKKLKLQFTKILAVKNDLTSKVEAAIQLQKQLSQREKDLENQINDLNDQSSITLNLLDQKKEALIAENDELRDTYSSYPSISFLIEQSNILSEILNTTVIKPKKYEIDEAVMRKIGVLQRSDENLSILEERLKYFVNRYDAMERSRKIASLQSPVKKSASETLEEQEYRRKIQLLKVTSKSSFDLIQYQCDALSNEIKRAKNEIETIKFVQSNRFSTPRKENLMFDREIREIIQIADGDQSMLHYNGANEYEYNGFRFTVQNMDDEVVAICDDDIIPLNIFLENIIYL
ncbi:hypothetical protein TRFO_27426 [Tritrichomonas foetus]|uniref:Uncharacterized protein n=1 Tax=Tritrichomonas foetus TaxID=1144522 RepID=A0A1J4K1Z2_9EUKA|nr:hypothetical protein TRFO_27426 [Tritrichomonas foetus]|eukprot:OHT04978.1 hypothetical protein TRFO_27426 [Tritrichomonas foetus]